MDKWTVPQQHFYYTGDPSKDVYRWESLSALKDAGGKFFSEATVEFFGVSESYLHYGGLIERRDNPPRSMRWGATWFDKDGQSIHTYNCPTENEARDAVVAVSMHGFYKVVEKEES